MDWCTIDTGARISRADFTQLFNRFAEDAKGYARSSLEWKQWVAFNRWYKKSGQISLKEQERKVFKLAWEPASIKEKHRGLRSSQKERKSRVTQSINVIFHNETMTYYMDKGRYESLLRVASPLPAEMDEYYESVYFGPIKLPVSIGITARGMRILEVSLEYAKENLKAYKAVSAESLCKEMQKQRKDIAIEQIQKMVRACRRAVIAAVPRQFNQDDVATYFDGIDDDFGDTTYGADGAVENERDFITLMAKESTRSSWVKDNIVIPTIELIVAARFFRIDWLMHAAIFLIRNLMFPAFFPAIFNGFGNEVHRRLNEQHKYYLGVKGSLTEGYRFYNEPDPSFLYLLRPNLIEMPPAVIEMLTSRHEEAMGYLIHILRAVGMGEAAEETVSIIQNSTPAPFVFTS